MSERKRCEWCNFILIEGQENPQLCGACYRRWLVDLPQGASNEEVEKEEKKWEIGLGDEQIMHKLLY